MPYGFINHIIEKGYSVETIRSYEKVIEQFFTYIRAKYPDNKEVFQISSRDIKNYLDSQLERKKSITTINKELAILKTLFNYLWEKDKVPVDPAVKIKRLIVKEKPFVDITHSEIITSLKKVLDNQDYSIYRKVIFLLASKGLKSSDFHILKEEVTDYIEKDMVEIHLKNRIIVLEDHEASCFQEYYYGTMFNGSQYVFTTKPRGDKSEEELMPIQVMSILNHLRVISRDYFSGRPLTLTHIRRSIAYDLYIKGHSIQNIAERMGIEESTASNYLKLISEGTVNRKSS